MTDPLGPLLTISQAVLDDVDRLTVDGLLQALVRELDAQRAKVAVLTAERDQLVVRLAMVMRTALSQEETRDD